MSAHSGPAGHPKLEDDPLHEKAQRLRALASAKWDELEIQTSNTPVQAACSGLLVTCRDLVDVIQAAALDGFEKYKLLETHHVSARNFLLSLGSKGYSSPEETRSIEHSADRIARLFVQAMRSVLAEAADSADRQLAERSYDPEWTLRGGGDSPDVPRDSFRRMALRVTVSLGEAYGSASEATDAWLERLFDHYVARNSQNTRDDWRLNRICEVSAEYCAERAAELHVSAGVIDERTFVDLERRFRELADRFPDLHAFRRRTTVRWNPTSTKAVPIHPPLGEAVQQKPESVKAPASALRPPIAMKAAPLLSEELAGSTRSTNAGEAHTDAGLAPASLAVDRQRLLDGYKAECRQAGVKINNEMIAKEADPGWNDRTPVEKWAAAKDARYNTLNVDRKIRRVLTEKPHLSNSSRNSRNSRNFRD